MTIMCYQGFEEPMETRIMLLISDATVDGSIDGFFLVRDYRSVVIMLVQRHHSRQANQ
jgi:hypothetical protein